MRRSAGIPREDPSAESPTTTFAHEPEMTRDIRTARSSHLRTNGRLAKTQWIWGIGATQICGK